MSSTASKLCRDFTGPKRNAEDLRRDCRGVEQRFQHLLLERSLFADVTFQVGSTPFAAHKLVLALGSPVFEEMFYSFEGIAEHPVITVTDLDAVGFRIMLLYLYSGGASFHSISDALSAGRAADRYELPELKQMTEDYLTRLDLRPSIVWPVLEEAEELNMTLTRRKCLDFVRRNTREVLRTEGFLCASLRVIHSVLNLNEVSVPEIELLDFVARWVKRRTRTHADATQAFFASLAPFIRFRALRPEELCSFVDRHPECLDDSDSARILKHLVRPDSGPLPEWCNEQPPRKNSLQPPRMTLAQKLWRTLKDPQLF